MVNVALRTIGEDLDASLAELQWINNGYLLTLASLILLGGSLGDRFGRRRLFVVGTVWFAIASLLCGLAPTAETLVVARLLQGIGGGLLTPGSLAMIQGAFVRDDRAPAIGAWSGLGGIAAAVGPFLGGALIDFASWRWIFLVNLPLAVDHRLDRAPPRPRVAVVDARAPASTCSAPGWRWSPSAGVTYALIQWGGRVAPVAGLVGLAAGVAFLVVESRVREPMMPLGLFTDRVFNAANSMTLLVYAALGAVFFFLVLQLQTVVGYSALEAGVATPAGHDLHAVPRLSGWPARGADRATDPDDGSARS